jgi:YidC/Oxa1 family membrane protein insertase
MAYRRFLLQRGNNLIDRRFHPSFTYVLHNDEPKRDQPDETKSSSTEISNSFIQRRSFRNSVNGSIGFFSSSQHRQSLSPFAGYNFCRNMSTLDQAGSDKITVMTDVADVLKDSTLEAAVSSQGPVVSEVAIAAADSYLPVQALQYVIDAVHSYTGLNW